MATLFSKIAAREIPSYRVAENDRFYAFLDINPVAKGHTLVIPRKEADYLFDLSDDEIADLMRFAKEVARKIEKAVPCKRVGMAVIGLEVPHVHIHLIPIREEKEMYFSNPKLKLPDEEMAAIAAAIRNAR